MSASDNYVWRKATSQQVSSSEGAPPPNAREIPNGEGGATYVIDTPGQWQNINSIGAGESDSQFSMTSEDGSQAPGAVAKILGTARIYDNNVAPVFQTSDGGFNYKGQDRSDWTTGYVEQMLPSQMGAFAKADQQNYEKQQKEANVVMGIGKAVIGGAFSMFGAPAALAEISNFVNPSEGFGLALDQVGFEAMGNGASAASGAAGVAGTNAVADGVASSVDSFGGAAASDAAGAVAADTGTQGLVNSAISNGAAPVVEAGAAVDASTAAQTAAEATTAGDASAAALPNMSQSPSFVDSLAKSATVDNFASGALKSAAVNSVMQLATTGSIDPSKLALNSILGGFGGILGGAVGDYFDSPTLGTITGGVATGLIGAAISKGNGAAAAAGGAAATTGATTAAKTATPTTMKFNTPELTYKPIVNRNDANYWSTAR